MTTPTTQPTPAQQAAEQFREEIRAQFASTQNELGNARAEIEIIRHELEALITAVGTITAGIQHAATATPPTTASNAPTMIIPMTRLIKTRTNGKNYYKMQGGQYMKRGITVWDEVLKVLDLDPATIEWDAQDAHTFKTPLNVTVLMQEYTTDEGEIKSGPQKVIGKA